MPTSKIIILNGVGSVRKSSTARVLQTMTREPFLHIAMDMFLDMLPREMMNHPQGLRFETTDDHGKPLIAITSGPVIERAMIGMRHAVAAIAAQGNNLLVDEVIIEQSKSQEYRTLLSAFDTHWVGLFAPLDVLEMRECDRGDRDIGLARGQYNRVHCDMIYDLEIDTTPGTSRRNATLIRDAFAL